MTLKTILNSALGTLGLEARRKPDPSLPMLHKPIVDGKTIHLWLTHPATKSWWHKDEIAMNGELSELKRLALSSLNVVEIGAHHGFMTLLLSDWIGSSGHVHAIEASQENVLVLDANCFENKKNNVTTTFAAAGEKSGTVRFGGESLAASMGLVREVPMLTVDEYCTGRGLHSVDLLKIDVEGFELGVLKGAQQTLVQSPKIALELHLDLLADANTSARQVWEFLEIHASLHSRNITMVTRPDWDNIVDVKTFSDLPTSGVANLFID